MEMNQETIRALLEAFDASDWREMTMTVGTDRLHVSRDALVNGAAAPAPPPPLPAPPPPPPQPPAPAPAAAAVTPPETQAPAAAPQAPPPGPPREADRPQGDAPGTAITAPSVGLFWRAPSPGAPPFVEVGARVEAGETVGIVEVMKLMNHVVAPVAGVVTAIHVENGAMVEFGEALVVVDPEG